MKAIVKHNAKCYVEKNVEQTNNPEYYRVVGTNVVYHVDDLIFLDQLNVIAVDKPASLIEPEMIFVESDDDNIKSFSIGKYPVTQAEWVSVMGDNPSYFKGENLPVECVNWYEANEYLEKLNQLTGKNYRLPTEAEWEYAARGGNKSKNFIYSGSNDINEVAWYDSNSVGKTHEVGLKKANELGLYDMSGNVWEWCADLGENTEYRCLRGGSWYYNVNNCRVFYRYNLNPSGKGFNFGFRIAL